MKNLKQMSILIGILVTLLVVIESCVPSQSQETKLLIQEIEDLELEYQYAVSTGNEEVAMMILVDLEMLKGLK